MADKSRPQTQSQADEWGGGGGGGASSAALLPWGSRVLPRHHSPSGAALPHAGSMPGRDSTEPWVGGDLCFPGSLPAP